MPLRWALRPSFMSTLISDFATSFRTPEASVFLSWLVAVRSWVWRSCVPTTSSSNSCRDLSINRFCVEVLEAPIFSNKSYSFPLDLTWALVVTFVQRPSSNSFLHPRKPSASLLSSSARRSLLACCFRSYALWFYLIFSLRSLLMNLFLKLG